MKYARRRNGKKLKTAILVLLVLLVALVGVLLYIQENMRSAEDMESSSATIVSGDTETTEPEQTQATGTEMADEKALVISTPYCDLYYPAQWKNQIRTETETTAQGCIVSFYGTVEEQEAKLFSVFFAEVSENSFPVGTIDHAGTMMDVSVELFDLESSGFQGTSADDIIMMQEGINYLIDKLEENTFFTAAGSQERGTAPEANGSSDGTNAEEVKVNNSDLVVSTGYCDLYYPAAWKQAVTTETVKQELGTAVTFYGSVNGKEAKLFTVFFAETSDESFPIGILMVDGMSMDVSLALHEPAEVATWETLEADTFYTMQEQSNYLVAKLRMNDAFSALDE